MNIIITGASSGIGAALAKAYARADATLGLMGRNKARLEEVARACEANGARVKMGLIDVREAEAMKAWLAAFDAESPVHLLIANAGVSVASASAAGESEAQVREVFDINVGGVLNCVLPVIPLMQARKSGQLAVVSSLAGLHGLPSCPAYSASKNAVRALGEGLRGALKGDGIRVNVICPGYIRTPMTEVNNFPMPFIMSAEKAAGIILSGLEKNKSRIGFPLALYLPLALLTCLPLWLTDPFFAALPRKTAN